MKRLAVFVLTLVVCLASASMSFSSEIITSGGKVFVNGLYTQYISSTNHSTFQIFVSNVTSVDVTCNITVYDQNGSTNCTSYGDVYAASTSGSGWVEEYSGTGEFALSAHSSRVYMINPSSSMPNAMYYVVIEWVSNDETLRKAVIASARSVQNIGGAYFTSQTSVNGGQIF